MNQATLWSHQMQLPAEDQSVPRARHFVCTLLIDHRFLDLAVTTARHTVAHAAGKQRALVLTHLILDGFVSADA